jgi:putative transcriptional regulator
MDFNPNKQTDILPATGCLLIAEPLLTDPNFARSVIYICEHGSEGTVGFALNRPTTHTLGDLLPDLYTPLLPVFQGGPVQLDTLHLLHRTPILFGGNEISPGIFWGGSYDALQHAVADNNYQPMDMRLFVGYSGWSAGQLEEEIANGAWIVANVDQHLLFDTDTDKLWKSAIQSLGKEFAFLMNVPLNPQLN